MYRCGGFLAVSGITWTAWWKIWSRSQWRRGISRTCPGRGSPWWITQTETLLWTTPPTTWTRSSSMTDSHPSGSPWREKSGEMAHVSAEVHNLCDYTCGLYELVLYLECTWREAMTKCELACQLPWVVGFIWTIFGYLPLSFWVHDVWDIFSMSYTANRKIKIKVGLYANIYKSACHVDPYSFVISPSPWHLDNVPCTLQQLFSQSKWFNF